MKKLIIIPVLFLLIITGCQKNNAATAAKTSVGNAVITSFSPDKCACCWGWNVEIDGKTYRIDKFPDDIDFDIDSITFPMAVSITWSESTGGCKGTIIDVQHISKL